MAIFIIFWFSVFGIVLRIISMILKAIRSLIYSIQDTVLECGKIAIVGGIAVLVLFMVLGFSTIIRKMSVGLIIGLIFIIGCIKLVFSVSESELVESIASLVRIVIGLCILALIRLNSYVERAYVFFLKKIIQKVNSL